MKKRVAFFRAVIVVSALVLDSPQIVHATPLLQGWPDLTVLQIDWTPGSPLVGDIMHFTVHVENQGDSDTSPWTQVGVCLFIDGTWIDDDYASNIAPGTTEFFDFYWTATSGCHTVRAVADCGDYIPESDEDNNERVESFCVSSPDLVVEQIDWTPGSPLVGDSMHFTVHVQNVGTADTSPWGQVGTRLSIDSTLIGDDQASNIAPGTTEFFDFYWTATTGHHTVRAVADYGGFIPESDENNNEREESFDVTCPTPSAPSLSSPSDGSSTCDTTPYLNWSSVSGATSYRIQVDDSSSFSSPAIDTTTSSSSYTPGTALSPGTYYWRVRASNSCGDSSWSSVWSVTILSTPGVPSLVSPSNGSTSDDSTPTLDWGGVSGATLYRVQVDDSSGFTSPEIDQTTSSTSYTPSSALADGTYYWRVQASNSCGSGSWSAAWSFTIETSCPAPPAPSLSSPSDGSSTCDTTPYLDWSSVSEATSYRIQVDDSSSFTSPAIDTTTSSSSYTPRTPLSPGTYYWRVNATNLDCGGTGPWSTVWSFSLTTPDNMLYFEPQHSSASFCNTTSVDIKIDAANFKSGQVKFTYNSGCADVTGWVRNTSDFPMGTWDSGTPGQEWITFSADESLTGIYTIGTLTIHCESQDDCTTPLDFAAGGSGTSKLFDDWGSEISATWQDGTFECTTGLCGDVAPYPGCDGQINMGDVPLLHSYVGHPGQYSLCCQPCGDVAPYPGCDGQINMGDVSLLHSYVGHPGQYNLCCEAASSFASVPPVSMPAEDQVSFVPQDSMAPLSGTTEVQIRVDATNFKSGQVKFTYDSTCADVTDWARNTSDFPMGTWESGTSGEEWITLSAQDAITGAYSIGTLTVRSVSGEACTTPLDFVEDGPMTSKLFDDWGSEISAAWQDGSFQGGFSVYLPIVTKMWDFTPTYAYHSLCRSRRLSGCSGRSIPFSYTAVTIPRAPTPPRRRPALRQTPCPPGPGSG